LSKLFKRRNHFYLRKSNGEEIYIQPKLGMGSELCIMENTQIYVRFNPLHVLWLSQYLMWHRMIFLLLRTVIICFVCFFEEYLLHVRLHWRFCNKFTIIYSYFKFQFVEIFCNGSLTKYNSQARSYSVFINYCSISHTRNNRLEITTK
jgi:hypothetical protein